MLQGTEYVLVNGRIIDPAADRDHPGWVHVRDGRIAAVGQTPQSAPPPVVPVDVAGAIIAPGLIDIHVHLREPGFEHKETIASGCAAAAAGGFTAVACMPNTHPAIDSPETVELIRRRAAQANGVRVHVIAAATRDRAGKIPVNVATLAAAGAVAFSDDGDGVEDDGVCRAIMEAVAACGAVFFPHCEFKHLSRRGHVHLGPVSARLGLTGYDPRGEEAMIERDLQLVEATGCRYHVAHVSTARGVELIRAAKAAGLPVTTEVCPHHLLLCDEDVIGHDGKPNPNCKMSPPLRSRADVAACVAGARDGTIDCVVTDHAPHTAAEKNAGFEHAPMGIVGLETALACAARALLNPPAFGWSDLIQRMSTAPARVLNLPGGSLAPQAPADLTVIDPHAEWVVDPDRFASRSQNSPFGGWRLTGRAIRTIVAGRTVYRCPDSGDFAGESH